MNLLFTADVSEWEKRKLLFVNKSIPKFDVSSRFDLGEGCTAAAVTVEMMEGAGMWVPDDEVDFILDRPFIFCVTGISGLPLFVGIVNCSTWPLPYGRLL